MRFWHYQRVGKSFRAHVRAETRRYQYLVPTQLFRPKSLPETEPFHFDEDTRYQVQLILNRFLGSHRFHHYTQGLTFKDPQSNRTINSFTVCEIGRNLTNQIVVSSLISVASERILTEWTIQKSIVRNSFYGVWFGVGSNNSCRNIFCFKSNSQNGWYVGGLTIYHLMKQFLLILLHLSLRYHSI